MLSSDLNEWWELVRSALLPCRCYIGNPRQFKALTSSMLEFNGNPSNISKFTCAKLSVGYCDPIFGVVY